MFDLSRQQKADNENDDEWKAKSDEQEAQLLQRIDKGAFCGLPGGEVDPTA